MIVSSATNTTARVSVSWKQVVGLACVLAWTNIAFFSRLVHYSDRSTLSHLNTAYAWATIGTIVALVGCACLCNFVFSRLAARSTASYAQFEYSVTNVLTLVASLLVAACTVVLILVEQRFFTQPWCSIAACVAGFATGTMFLGWAPRLLNTGKTNALYGILGAFVLAAALFVLVLYLPNVPALVLTIALPLASYGLYRSDSATDTFEPAVEDRRSSAIQPVFARALLAVALMGFGESLVRALFLEVDPIAGTVAYRWLYLAATLVSAGIIVSTNLLRGGTNAVTNMNRVATIAFAVLTLLSPIVSGLSLAADLPPLICYCMFYMLVWIYLAQTAHAYRISARRLFGFGLGAAYAGCLVGTFLGGVLTSTYDPSWRIECLIALVCAVLVMLAFIFLADDRTLSMLIDAESDRPQTPRRFRLRVEEVAQAYGLTAKETEVLMLAAKGRTNQRIREELGISTGTVNTHLMHIYKKLDVHDRQQMLDMLDGHDEAAGQE